MPKHLMIAVNWYGPYKSLEDARNAALPYDWPGLYLCIGQRTQENISRLQYIGISNSLSSRLISRHHKLGTPNNIDNTISNMKIWLGDISTAEPSGKRMKVTLTTLDYAEWLHARFLKLPLNDKKTKQLPPRSVTVLNRWFYPDFESPYRNRPHRDWPNLIDYPHNGMTARAVWFGGKQKTFSAPNYELPLDEIY